MKWLLWLVVVLFPVVCQADPTDVWRNAQMGVLRPRSEAEKAADQKKLAEEKKYREAHTLVASPKLPVRMWHSGKSTFSGKLERITPDTVIVRGNEYPIKGFIEADRKYIEAQRKLARPLVAETKPVATR